ncbi:MAG: hypothetical protein GY909_08000 [Oligoflexia bacterium]|nr:hypothetical protein [Oligoflexia bacterium]
MKLFFLVPCFWLLLSTTYAKFSSNLQLSVDKAYDLYEQSKKCDVVKSSEEYHLCSGLNISEKFVQQYNTWTLKSCLSEIRKLGYATKLATDNNKLSREILTTSKKALVYYRQKTVFYLESIKKSDCFHEFLHILQRVNPSTSPLSVKNRKPILNNLLNEIEKAVTIVEREEKNKNTKVAKELGKKLQSMISFYKDLQQRFQLLDEVELYLFYYQFANDLKLSPSEKELALTNLIQYQKVLPWEKRIVLKRVAKELHLSKIEKYKKVPFKNSDLVDLDRKFNQGKVSRTNYEKIKYSQLAHELENKARSLDSIKKKVLLNKFDQCKEFNYSMTRFKKRDDLYFYDDGIILDTGANDSVFLASKKDSGSVCHSKSLSFYNQQTKNLPVLQRTKSIGKKFWEKEGFKYIPVEKLPGGLKGIIGLSAFKDTPLCLDIKRDIADTCLFNFDKVDQREVFKLDFKITDADAIEFYCDKNTKIRIDSGSQVYGDRVDIRSQIPLSGRCLGLRIDQNKMATSPFNSIYFKRDVDFNLGTGWLNQFTMIAFDLKKKKLRFFK